MVADFERFLASLQSPQAAEIRVHANGSKLLIPQPWRGRLAYLHVVHPGLDTIGMEQLEGLYGRRFPETLRSIHRIANGMELFEASLSLFGLVRHFTRSTDACNPFSPEIAVRTFPETHAEWNRRGFFPIGSWALYSYSFCITSNDAGEIAVVSDEAGDALRQYPDICAALTSLSAELAPFWTAEGRRMTPETRLDLLAGPFGTA